MDDPDCDSTWEEDEEEDGEGPGAGGDEDGEAGAPGDADAEDEDEDEEDARAARPGALQVQPRRALGSPRPRAGLPSRREVGVRPRSGEAAPPGHPAWGPALPAAVALSPAHGLLVPPSRPPGTLRSAGTCASQLWPSPGTLQGDTGPPSDPRPQNAVLCRHFLRGMPWAHS